MIEPLFGLASIFVLLLLVEVWRRERKLHPEVWRKLIHITVGSVVAFWPFVMSFGWIQFVSCVLLCGVIVSRHLGIFGGVHNVERQTWGDVLFPIGIGVTAIITHEPWVFAAAILHMAVADGFAGLIGSLYGRRGRYAVAGHHKSVLGTVVFGGCSVLILLLANHYGALGLSGAEITAIAAGAMLVENLAPWGSDNLLIPVFVSVVLTKI
jgi:phytol kinase